MQVSTQLQISPFIVTFWTVLVVKYGCKQVRNIPIIVSKLLTIAIRSGCALRLESQRTPFSGTGC